MDRSIEENGAAKPLEDPTSEQYSAATGDQHQLIQGGGSEVCPLQMEQEKSQGRCAGEGLKVIIISSVSFSIAITVALIVSIFFGPPQVPPHGGVACELKVCSDVGVDILKKGGSSVDAAIATTFCVGVVHAQSSGIGGGGVMIVRNSKKEVTKVFDFLDLAPAGATKDMFNSDANLAKEGGLAVGVPGQVAGLEAVYNQYGKLSWKELVTPAIELAKKGFNVTKQLENDISLYLTDEVRQNYPKLAEAFTVNGKLAVEGDTLTRPNLAVTLEAIADEGSQALYAGSLTNTLVTEINGDLSKDDMKNYNVKTREPIDSTLNEVTVQTLPPPSSGAIILSILNILESFGIAAANRTDPVTYQRLVEAIKFGYAQQGLLGDPDFVDMSNMTRQIISKSMAITLSSKISDTTTQNAAYYINEVESALPVQTRGTAQISVIGPDDFIVSTTSSLNQEFGSFVMTSSGILLNNHMADFTIPRSELGSTSNNYVEPGKRPVSSMAPAIVYSIPHPCTVRFGIGGAKGSSIISAMSQVLMNVIAFGDTITEAIQAPRLHAQLKPEQVEYESELDQTIVDYLTTAGHNMVPSQGISYVDIVAKVNETVYSYADLRSGAKSTEF